MIAVEVPGPWASLAELGIATLPDGFVAADGQLLHIRTRARALVELRWAPEGLASSYEAEGRGRLDRRTLARLADCRSIVRLTHPETGLAGARFVLRAIAAVLDAGGVAVRVDAGVVHPAAFWHAKTDHPSPLACYEAFVALEHGEGEVRSRGMQVLGRPDGRVAGDLPIERLAAVATELGHWSLLEPPNRDPDPVFVEAPGGGRFAVRKQSDPENPRGRWHLHAVRPDAQLRLAFDPRRPTRLAAAIDDATRRAHRTLSVLYRFVCDPYDHGVPMVRARVCDGDAEASLWLEVLEASPRGITAELREEPDLPSLRVGDTVELDIDAVEDWAIHKGGTVLGGYTRRRDGSEPARRYVDVHEA